MDSCYLCEFQLDGMAVPFDDRMIWLCFKCLLECVYSHPKLVAFKKGNAA